MADLRHAGRADGALVPIEFQASRIPLEAAGRDQAARDSFLIVDHFLVSRRHESAAAASAANGPSAARIAGSGWRCALAIVGPADAAEIGHPARHRHVAQVAAAVNERRPGKQHRQQSRDTYSCPASCRRCAATVRRRARRAFPNGPRRAWAACADVSFGRASRGGPACPTTSGNGLERSPHQTQLAGAVNRRVAGQHLLDQRCARARQSEDEHRPCGIRPAVAHASEELAIELLQ